MTNEFVNKKQSWYKIPKTESQISQKSDFAPLVKSTSNINYVGYNMVQKQNVFGRDLRLAKRVSVQSWDGEYERLCSKSVKF